MKEYIVTVVFKETYIVEAENETEAKETAYYDYLDDKDKYRESSLEFTTHERNKR